MNAYTPITAPAKPVDYYYPTCPDCGGSAQGTGMFGKPYCGLCCRSIPDFVPLVSITRDPKGGVRA